MTITLWGTDLDPIEHGRLPGAKPVAVLDIGSNSIRLVVYERHARTLTPLYNEKSSAALGRGLGASGRLSDQSIAKAIVAIRRFALVVRLMQVDTVYILATSATREASNGAAFTSEVEQIMGCSVQVLSGAEEAHFAALGVVAGINTFKGVVGDLGGGSLELAAISDGIDAVGETHGIGAIRLQDDSGMVLSKAKTVARERLELSKVLDGNEGGVFAAIGGTWRALAKLHQMRTHYPLHMVQHYCVPATEIMALCDSIIDASVNKTALSGMRMVSSSRRELLPYGAVVLGEVLRRGKFSSVVFSALGLREGFLYSLLSEEERGLDPLLQAALEMSQLRARSPLHGSELIAFSDNFTEAMGEAETKEDRRLRIAACLLSDIGWRGHPDYRGEQSVDLVAYGSMTGIEHSERAYLSEVLAVRYMGLKHKSVSSAIMKLAGPISHKRARLLGALFRVAYPMSAGMPGVLNRVRFVREDNTIVLILPLELEFLSGERVHGRMAHLAGEANLDGYAIRAE